MLPSSASWRYCTPFLYSKLRPMPKIFSGKHFVRCIRQHVPSRAHSKSEPFLAWYASPAPLPRPQPAPQSFPNNLFQQYHWVPYPFGFLSPSTPAMNTRGVVRGGIPVSKPFGAVDRFRTPSQQRRLYQCTNTAHGRHVRMRPMINSCTGCRHTYPHLDA